ICATITCITQGTVQTTNLIPWNACGASCTTAQTVFGTLEGTSLKCGTGLPTTPNGATINPNPCAVSVINPDLYTPYVTNSSVNLQQQVGRRVSFVLGYVGSHGSGIRQQVDLNQPYAGSKNANSCPAGTVIPTTYVGGVPTAFAAAGSAYCKNL